MLQWTYSLAHRKSAYSRCITWIFYSCIPFKLPILWYFSGREILKWFSYLLENILCKMATPSLTRSVEFIAPFPKLLTGKKLKNIEILRRYFDFCVSKWCQLNRVNLIDLFNSLHIFRVPKLTSVSINRQ